MTYFSDHGAIYESYSPRPKRRAEPVRAGLQTPEIAVKDGIRFRIFDLTLCLLALVPVACVIALLSLVIKLDDPVAPIFYIQTRYGRNGTPFRIFKLRTMVPDADARKAELLALSVDKGAGFKLANDPRVTRPGRWLRKAYLDELPQIWNVLRGEMSFVGPRANSCPPDALEPWQRARLAVRPGITGTWQIMRDKPAEFVERCKIDLDYIASKSLLGDIRVIVSTAMIAFVRRTGV